MTKLIKIGYWTEGVRLNVVFVHGLGGSAYDTWRKSGEDNNFWPVWLARDIPGLTGWTLDYDAAMSNWLGTSMPIQDRAKNVLECLLGRRELRGAPIVFVCHSLGGLVVKQVLRAADGRRAFSAETQALLDAVKGVVFIATPHTGSMHATLLDKLRLIAWPSASTLDLVKNNANLRDLNTWYRNWSGSLRHKVFYEKQGTTAGVIVGDDSSDPGLLHVDPVGIDADHRAICKPADVSDLVYIRTRDFLTDEIVPGVGPGAGYGTFQAPDLLKLPHARSARFAPIALRLAVISIVGLLLFKGAQALFFPPDALSAATVEQITGAIRAKSPELTPTQIEHFIDALRQASGEPSFERAVEEAKKGNTRVAEGIRRQIYENREKEQSKARKEQADAARNLAASAVTNNVAEGLSWYKKAATLDPDNMAGWLGLGDAAKTGGNLQEADRAFHRYVELARRTGNDPATARGLTRLGEVMVAQGHRDEELENFREGLAIYQRLAAVDRSDTRRQADVANAYSSVGDALMGQGHHNEALKNYREGLAIRERLSATDRSNTDLQFKLSLSYDKIGEVLMQPDKIYGDPVAQDQRDKALKNYRDGLAIRERLAAADRSNTDLQRAISWSHDRIGGALRQQKQFDEALENYRDSRAIRERLAAADRSNTNWQRDLSLSYNNIANILVALGKRDEALLSYRSGLAVAARLAAMDSSNAGWQNDLAFSYFNLADMLVSSQPDEALKNYRVSLAILERLVTIDRVNVQDINPLLARIGGLAYVFMKARKFDNALDASDLAISRSPATLWPRANRAHALLFLGRVDEAREIYLGYLGKREVSSGEPWEKIVLVDFTNLQKAGLTHPLIGEMKEKFAARGSN